MSDEPEIKDRKKRSRAGCVLLLLMVVLVLYALSPPFLAFVHDQLPPSAQPALLKVAGVIYAPLNCLYFNVEIVKDFYDWYQGLFDSR